VKVLLADANSERGRAVEQELVAAGASSVIRPLPGENLRDAVARVSPDLVIVDMARPDRDSLDDLHHLSRHDPRPVVMFVDRDDPAFMTAAIAAGVSSYNVVDAALPAIKPIVGAAVAMFRRFRQVEEELQRAEASLKERALIERAKSLVMRQCSMTEPEAYRWLRRTAMAQSRRIADIAAAVLAAGQEKK
jgi:two-component system, response regulator / RNA-binding antiterminator